jgi:hypothetical protein
MSCFAEIYDRINLKNDQQDRTFLSGIGGAYGKMGFVHEKPGTHRQGADTGRGHTGRVLSSGGPCLAEKQAWAVSDFETVGGQANLPTFLGMYRRLGASGRDKPSWSGPGGKRGSRRRSGAGNGQARFFKGAGHGDAESSGCLAF